MVTTTICFYLQSVQHPNHSKLPHLRLSQRPGANHSASYYQLPNPPLSPCALGSGDGRWDQPYALKLPRRVRLWNFWARTRVAQRGIMVGRVRIVWVCVFRCEWFWTCGNIIFSWYIFHEN